MHLTPRLTCLVSGLLAILLTSSCTSGGGSKLVGNWIYSNAEYGRALEWEFSSGGDCKEIEHVGQSLHFPHPCTYTLTDSRHLKVRSVGGVIETNYEIVSISDKELVLKDGANLTRFRRL